MNVVDIPQYKPTPANSVKVNTQTIAGIQYCINLFITSGSGINSLYHLSHFFFSSTTGLLSFFLSTSDNLI